jgi:hypothetical protein
MAPSSMTAESESGSGFGLHHPVFAGISRVPAALGSYIRYYSSSCSRLTSGQSQNSLHSPKCYPLSSGRLSGHKVLLEQLGCSIGYLRTADVSSYGKAGQNAIGKATKRRPRRWTHHTSNHRQCSIHGSGVVRRYTARLYACGSRESLLSGRLVDGLCYSMSMLTAETHN